MPTTLQVQVPFKSMGDDHDSERLPIGALARLAGLQPSALRYYEQQGLLASAGRAGGHRVFDADGVRQLAAIDFWQEAGFTLREIGDLVGQSPGSVERMKHVATERIAELERIIEDATHVKEFLQHVLGCEHEDLLDCPWYRDHIRLRAERITGGTHRRRHELRLQRIHSPQG
jgi:DNA-binding transcriptional MerR regulator